MQHNQIFEYLLDVPIAYENNFIAMELIYSNLAVYEIEIVNVSYSKKQTTFRAKLVNFDLIIEIIFFHFKPYLKKFFYPKNRLYIKTTFKKFGMILQAIQPKIITKPNELIVTYKNKRKQIDKNNMQLMLNGFYLSPQFIDNLLKVHYPDVFFVDYVVQHKSFPADILSVLKFFEAFAYCYKLSLFKKEFQSKKQFFKSPDEFVANLPFILTDDQCKALADITHDLSLQKASRRIVVGDVGSGKTILILAAAFIAYPNRSILLAPTSILAEQIYLEAIKYLPREMKITLFTSKTKPKDLLDEYHFFIGTHALLHADLPEIDLIMVDEQHRFGTNQRNQIARLHEQNSARPHFIQFSATPIPRTQAMIESSLVDFSFLKQTPFSKEITTTIVDKKNFDELLLHFKHEIALKNQIIIVYPLVENNNNNSAYSSIEKAQLFWKKNFDNVFVTYGKDKEKLGVIEDFRENGDILIATTLIEVGISLPRLSTIVIVGAEKMGLATLHQLRGRVSRNGLKGYCFLYTNDISNKKLKKFAQTISGFDIAEMDLELRNSGDLISGVTQSGYNFRFLDLSTDKVIIYKSMKHFEEFFFKSNNNFMY